jgi:hypothetical protein
MAYRLIDGEQTPQLPSAQPIENQPVLPESWGQFGLRNILGTGSDIITNVLGLPGAAINAGTSAVSGLQGLLGAPSIVEDEGFVPYQEPTIPKPRFPGTEDIRAELPTYLTERKTPAESFARNVVSEAPFNVVAGPGGWFAKGVRTLAKTAAAEGIGRGVGEVAGELPGQAAKIASLMVMSQPGLKNFMRQESAKNRQLWNEAIQQSPNKNVTLTPEINKSINEFKKELSTGYTESPEKQFMRKLVDDYERVLKNPGPNQIEELTQFKKDTNALFRSEGTPRNTSGYLRRFNAIQKETLKEWSMQNNPQAWPALAQSDALYQSLSQMGADQDKAWNNITWVLHGLGGRFHGAAAFLKAARAGQAAAEFASDPVKMGLVGKLLSEGLSGSKGAIASTISKLDKVLGQRQEKPAPTQPEPQGRFRLLD